MADIHDYSRRLEVALASLPKCEQICEFPEVVSGLPGVEGIPITENVAD